MGLELPPCLACPWPSPARRSSHLRAAALLVLVLGLGALPCGALGPRGAWMLGQSSSGAPRWLNQTLDHFSATDKRTFQQRYFEAGSTPGASGPGSPVLLYICGEAPCGGVPNNFVLGLAESWGAPAVALEHRYYGESQPFSDLSTSHLAYLSTHQALADLAAFRQFYQAKRCSSFTSLAARQQCHSSKWVVVGGSYAGAMSAWLRLKYPHLFHASLASSAVIDVILDFYQFDQQVRESAGPACASCLEQVTVQAESLLRQDRAKLLDMFGASGLKDNRDFLFFLADAAVFSFQYGRPDAVCFPLLAAKAQGQDLLEAFSRYTKDVFIGVFHASISDYDQEALRSPTITSRSEMRAWWYQCCTEMAYFQNAPQNDSLRSAAINMEYWKDFCASVFGEGIFPDTDNTNTFYGSTGIAGSRIVFSNGSQDPWKRASLRRPRHGEPSVEVPCHNCGHCVDLRGCPPNSTFTGLPGAEACTDPGAVREARRFITDTLTMWLQEPAVHIAPPTFAA